MLDLEERGEVAIMRLQHGKVNALDLELLLAITEAMRAVDQARAVASHSSPARVKPADGPGALKPPRLHHMDCPRPPLPAPYIW